MGSQSGCSDSAVADGSASQARSRVRIGRSGRRGRLSRRRRNHPTTRAGGGRPAAVRPTGEELAAAAAEIAGMTPGAVQRRSDSLELLRDDRGRDW